MTAQIETRLKKVLSEVFGVSEGQINPQTSMENVEGWDSLQHLNWVAALEQEFGIMFSEDELPKLKSYREALKIISEHLN